MAAKGMKDLIELLKDGHARTIPMLADEMNESESDVLRQIEYLEHIGRIRRVFQDKVSCKGCSGCSSKDGAKACKSCLPDGGFKNMGQMWEVI